VRPLLQGSPQVFCIASACSSLTKVGPGGQSRSRNRWISAIGACDRHQCHGAGNVKWSVPPRTPLPLAQIRPPCDSTIDLLIAKPMPLPCGFVVKNASNIWSALPGGSPGPVSSTEISLYSQTTRISLCTWMRRAIFYPRNFKAAMHSHPSGEMLLWILMRMKKAIPEWDRANYTYLCA
jgi:hypothetical protein